MSIDRDMLSKVADLARLRLNEAEKEEFYGQLAHIVHYFAKINEIDIADVEPAAHIIEIRNVFRQDTGEANFNPDGFKKIAPEYEKGHVVVPAAIEDRRDETFYCA